MMMPVVYDVAVSADGYIAGPFNDVSAFPDDGELVVDFMQRLRGYACVIMGRRTYELGYESGLFPGQRAYPGMRNIVVSGVLDITGDCEIEILKRNIKETVQLLQATEKSPIYLNGGGNLAGWLMAHGLIDMLRLSRVPILLGSGTRLFGSYEVAVDARLVETKVYQDGSLFQEFEIHG